MDALHMGLLEHPDDCPEGCPGGSALQPLLDHLQACLDGLWVRRPCCRAYAQVADLDHVVQDETCMTRASR